MLANIQHESKTANDEKKKTYLVINEYEIFRVFLLVIYVSAIY